MAVVKSRQRPSELTAAEMSVVVIILTVNQCARTLDCLGTLMRAEDFEFQVLVWDNGSNDGSAQVLQAAFPEALVHHHPENLGVASGRNAAAELAIKHFAPTHLLFLDNDMLVEPQFVDALLRPFLDHHGVGQTQAKLRFIHDRKRLNDGGGARIDFLRWRVAPVGFGEVDRGQYDVTKPCIACGGAMMVRTDIFQELHGFDTAFDPFGPEDLDFSLRLQKAGYTSLYTPDAVACHAVSHTFGAGYTEEYARHKARHWLLFMKRHAPRRQQLGFFLLGAPYLAVRTALREIKKGNLVALRGIVRGLVDFARKALARKDELDDTSTQRSTIET